MKLHSTALILVVSTFLGTATLVWAQGQTSPLPTPAQQPQTQQVPQQLLSPDQLNNLVAPIALYPDPLLGQLLVASTYPLEVVEANQWLERNKHLRGQELVDAARQQSWDPSVQALVAVPDALAKLNQDIRWTTDLGNAFLAQQADVMTAVQQMRARAQGNGNLSSTPQQTVTTQAQGGQQVIIIQPADPQVIYVPSYDPVYVWGPPVYGYYPPLYYTGFGFGFGHGFNLGFCFDGWGGWGGWGWGPNWFGRSVFLNNSFFHRYRYHPGYGGGFGGRTIWSHNPGHRLDVPYANHQIAARYRGASMASRNSYRAGTGSRSAAASYANSYSGRSAGRAGEQGYQRYTAPPQAQRSRDQPYQRYQAPQQYRSSPQQVRDAPQQNRSALQQYRAAPQQQYRSGPQQFRSAPQEFRSAPQQFRSSPHENRSAPQQFRSSPQMSAPRVSGGGNSGGGGGSHGSGGSFRGGHSSGGGGGRRH